MSKQLRYIIVSCLSSSSPRLRRPTRIRDLWSWPKKLLLRIRVIRHWQGLLTTTTTTTTTTTLPTIPRCPDGIAGATTGSQDGYNYWAFDDASVCNVESMVGDS